MQGPMGKIVGEELVVKFDVLEAIDDMEIYKRVKNLIDNNKDNKLSFQETLAFAEPGMASGWARTTTSTVPLSCVGRFKSLLGLSFGQFSMPPERYPAPMEYCAMVFLSLGGSRASSVAKAAALADSGPLTFASQLCCTAAACCCGSIPSGSSPGRRG